MPKGSRTREGEDAEGLDPGGVVDIYCLCDSLVQCFGACVKCCASENDTRTVNVDASTTEPVTPSACRDGEKGRDRRVSPRDPSFPDLAHRRFTPKVRVLDTRTSRIRHLGVKSLDRSP